MKALFGFQYCVVLYFLVDKKSDGDVLCVMSMLAQWRFSSAALEAEDVQGASLF